MKRSCDAYDWFLAPLCEAGLLLLAGSAAMLVHKPLFFASLGPTAYELAETPERRSAQPYSVIVGHLIGVVSGFLALYISQAWRAPAVNTYSITWIRVWAAMLAAIFTVVGTTLFKATQPGSSINYSHGRHVVHATASGWPGYYGGDRSSYHCWRAYEAMAMQTDSAAKGLQGSGRWQQAPR